MGDLGGYFDATQHESSGYEPLPAGKYVLEIFHTEKKPTANGSGTYIQLVMAVCEGPYKDRQLKDNLNLWHSNPQTVEIAQKQLSAYCYAVGKKHINDSSELFNIKFLASVTVTPPKGDYGPGNKVKPIALEPEGLAALQQPASHAAPQPQQRRQANPAAAPRTRGGGVPWQRKPQQQPAPGDDDIPF